MSKKIMSVVALVAIFSVNTHAFGWNDFMNKVKKPAGEKASTTDAPSSYGLSTDTIVSGLKEALSVATEKAVDQVSQSGGYLNNDLIKIPLPGAVKPAADMLNRFGAGHLVDEFSTTMNQAAEQAAPEASAVFIDAIKDMSIADAKQVLAGEQTAATDYFKEKTYQQLYGVFKPMVSTSMDNVGVTRAYKNMVSGYQDYLPFARNQSMDLDHYVTEKSLDGLFKMIAEQEKLIRANPAERTTQLLKTVFGR